MSEIQDFAQSVFDSGLNCAESTILALAKYLERENDLIPRIATAFGGGMSRTKSVCGVVSGALMAIGLLWGRNRSGESKDKCYAEASLFIDDFKQKFGSINCFELSGLDFSCPDDLKLYREKIHSECCVELVRYAVEKVFERSKNVG